MCPSNIFQIFLENSFKKMKRTSIISSNNSIKHYLAGSRAAVKYAH